MKINSWIIAVRLKTLPASISPVIIGTSLAYNHPDFSLLPSIIAGLCAILFQIISNLANDYFDFINGFDNQNRIGPQRVILSGLLSAKEIKIGIITAILISLILGLYLIWIGGVIIMLIGIISIIGAISYSAGPYPLSSNGLGDLFVFLFFGVTAVNGTYYLHTLNFNGAIFVSSISIGSIITSILVINNLRDFDTDMQTNKITFVGIIGRQNSIYYYILLLSSSQIIPFLLFFFYNFSLSVFIPLLLLPEVIYLTQKLNLAKTGPQFNKILSRTAIHSLVYSILFSIGVIL